MRVCVCASACVNVFRQVSATATGEGKVQAECPRNISKLLEDSLKGAAKRTLMAMSAEDPPLQSHTTGKTHASLLWTYGVAQGGVPCWPY